MLRPEVRKKTQDKLKEGKKKELYFYGQNHLLTDPLMMTVKKVFLFLLNI